MKDKILKLLTEGANPKGLALTCAVGAGLALFPILGTTTALCLIAGLALKLNQPILQAVNYVLYPVQILMLPVFLSLGASLTNSPSILVNPATMISDFKADPKEFLSHFGAAGFHAVLVWFVIAPLFSVIVYQISIRIFLKWRPAT